MSHEHIHHAPVPPQELIGTPREWPAPMPKDDVEMAFYEKFFLSKDLEPYPVQEEAFNHIFADENVLVMVPTGTGKTMIAKSGLMKALYTQKTAIYTTPLRALTEEKYRELCGDFGSKYVGFATGDYKINPQAPIQVMVAEIVWNMIYGGRRYTPADMIVMDEGHYFNDPSRGYVWEQSIIGLDPATQLVILSATIGNPEAFCQWSYLVRGTPMTLVRSSERRVPLLHHYEEHYLIEQVRSLHKNEEVPAIIFCFSRQQCFDYARQLKSCSRFTTEEEQAAIAERAKPILLEQGLSEKLLGLLTHGIGIHHSGILPKYKQLVEELTLERLLKFIVSTETISAGINLPAKRVLFPSIRKHVRRESRLLLPAEYHQMAGRAGRPQFDTEGIAITLAPEEVVQEFRKELKAAQKSRRNYDEAQLRKRAYSRARTEARKRGDISWGPEDHEQLVEGKPAGLRSQTRITAEQILAIGLPDLTERVLPGHALVEAEKQAEAKRQADRDAKMAVVMQPKADAKEAKGEKKRPRDKDISLGNKLAGLGALLNQVKAAEPPPEEPPAEEASAPETPEESQTADLESPESTAEAAPAEPSAGPSADEATGETAEAKAAENPTDDEGASQADDEAAAPVDAGPTRTHWPEHLPLRDALSDVLASGETWPKDEVLPPPLLSHRQNIPSTVARYNIVDIIDQLFIDDNDKRESHKLLAKITNNLQALGILDEHGIQKRGWIIGDLRGIDGPFVYYCLMHHDFDYPEARELVETLVDHDVIHRILNRKVEDEKREWMRNRLRERRMDEPLVSWDDVEAEYERKFPRPRSFVEQLHDKFVKQIPHPELHGRKRFKTVWAQMEDQRLPFMDFVERHKLEAEEGNLFSYLSRILKTARMLHETTSLPVFRLLELRVRSQLGRIDDRILDSLWYRRSGDQLFLRRRTPRQEVPEAPPSENDGDNDGDGKSEDADETYGEAAQAPDADIDPDSAISYITNAELDDTAREG